MQARVGQRRGHELGGRRGGGGEASEFTPAVPAKFGLEIERKRGGAQVELSERGSSEFWEKCGATSPGTRLSRVYLRECTSMKRAPTSRLRPSNRWPARSLARRPARRPHCRLPRRPPRLEPARRDSSSSSSSKRRLQTRASSNKLGASGSRRASANRRAACSSCKLQARSRQIRRRVSVRAYRPSRAPCSIRGSRDASSAATKSRASSSSKRPSK